MNNIFICDNYNHILLSIIKNFNASKGTKNDLLICNNWSNDKLLNDTSLINNIKKMKLFNKVIVYNYYYAEEQKINNSRFKDLKKYFLTKKIIKENKIDFTKYNEIYMFYDVTEIGKVLNIKGIKYNILEDGVDCFKNNKDLILPKKDIKTFIKKRFLKYPVSLGMSKNVKSIEVNDKKGVFINNKNIIECNKKEMFSNLTKAQKDIIFKVFLDEYDFSDISGSSLIITQPLFMDNLLSSEKQQIDLYKKIINDYCSNEKIVIKTHPRDKVNYDDSFSNCIIIKKNFPIELLNFFDNISFNKIISVSSTSVSLLNNCNEKIILGWDWLNDYKAGVNYEK